MNLSVERDLSFFEICWKTVVVHSVTYFVAGLSALLLLHYGSQTTELDSLFRGIDHPLVMAGPLLQAVRGILFASVFYLLRSVFFATPRGWFILFWTLVTLGILSTFGPPPGSLEAMVFTTLPISIYNYVEVVPQAFALSFLLAFWLAHPSMRWFSVLMIAAYLVMATLIIMGLTLS